jgi:hypothetical protein
VHKAEKPDSEAKDSVKPAQVFSEEIPSLDAEEHGRSSFGNRGFQLLRIVDDIPLRFGHRFPGGFELL